MDQSIRKKRFIEDDLTNNPSTRVPVCLCLDTSFSMMTRDTDSGNTRIEELQKGIEMFMQAIQNDKRARYKAELCLITFNNEIDCIREYATLYREGQEPESAPQLQARGTSFLGEGINLALDKLESRKQEYKDRGIDYFQPWLVIMSDGRNNGEDEELERAINRIQNLIQNKRLTVFPIAIGNKANRHVLNQLSAPNRPALSIKGMQFDKFFEWLSKSVETTSNSLPGGSIDLPDFMSWAEL